jgi:CheY-like chemotaxis protein
MTILLVDDDQDDVYIFREAITTIDPNIECIHALDGIEALQRLEDTSVDIVFLDLNMPRMDGTECLKEIRKKNDLASVPVIIYSTAPEMLETETTDSPGVTVLKKDISYLNTVVAIKGRLKELGLL